MVKIFTTLNELMFIKDDWIELAKLSASPLLDFDWFISCLETIDKDKRIHVITIVNGQRITAIAPLCLINKSGIHTLEIIGSTMLYEPSGFLFASRFDLDNLIQAIIAQKYPVTLLRLPADSEDYNKIFLPRVNGAFRLRKITAPSNYIKTDDSFDDFVAKLSSNRRYDFKRKRRCLAEKGDVQQRIFNPTISELDRILNVAFEIENRGWKGRNKSSLLTNHKLQAFFRNYLNKSCLNNELRICLYYIDGRAIAMHIAVVAYNRFWVLKLGYDEILSKCSPGILQAMDTIEYAFNENLKGYEFLGSGEKWQLSWPVQQHRYCTILLFPYSLRGLVGLINTIAVVATSKLKRITGQ